MGQFYKLNKPSSSNLIVHKNKPIELFLKHVYSIKNKILDYASGVRNKIMVPPLVHGRLQRLIVRALARWRGILTMDAIKNTYVCVRDLMTVDSENRIF